MSHSSTCFWKSVVAIKVAVCIAYCFIGFVLPHITRQVDTLGVSMRYAKEWQAGHWTLLPRTLAAGDAEGITPLEFPVLNFVGALGFYSPTVETGRTVARLLILGLSVLLLIANYRVWKESEILGHSAGQPILLLAVVGISRTYLMRYMPDLAAFLLCLWAVGLSWKKPQPVRSTILAAIGLLIKPSAVITLALVFYKRTWKKDIFWSGLSLLPAALYYTKGTQYLRSVSDVPEYFYTSFRNPLTSLLEFAQAPAKQILGLINMDLFTSLGLVFLLLGVFGLRRHFLTKDSIRLWLLLALQIFVIILLDGAHSLIHPYYYMGTAFTVACLMWDLLRRLEPNRLLSLLALGLLLGSQVEQSFYLLRPPWQSDPSIPQALWKQCQSLRAQTPDWPWGKTYRFRSPVTPTPNLGVCFGEIEGSQRSQYGIAWIDSEVPAGCTTTAHTERLQLFVCSPSGT